MQRDPPMCELVPHYLCSMQTNPEEIVVSFQHLQVQAGPFKWKKVGLWHFATLAMVLNLRSLEKENALQDKTD